VDIFFQPAFTAAPSPTPLHTTQYYFSTVGLRAQVKVRVCRLGLLPSRLNGGPVCDDSAALSGVRKCGAI